MEDRACAYCGFDGSQMAVDIRKGARGHFKDGYELIGPLCMPCYHRGAHKTGEAVAVAPRLFASNH